MARRRALKERFKNGEIAPELTEAWMRFMVLPRFNAERCAVLDEERRWTYDVEQIGALRYFSMLCYPVVILALVCLWFGWTWVGLGDEEVIFYEKGNPTTAAMAILALTFIFLQHRRLRRAANAVVEWYPADLRFSQSLDTDFEKLEDMMRDMGCMARMPLADIARCRHFAEKKMLRLVKSVRTAELSAGKKPKSKSRQKSAEVVAEAVQDEVDRAKQEVKEWRNFLSRRFGLVEDDVAVYYNKVGKKAEEATFNTDTCGDAAASDGIVPVTTSAPASATSES